MVTAVVPAVCRAKTPLASGGTGGLSLIPLNSGGSGTLVLNKANNASAASAAVFQNAGTSVGSITYTNTLTAYNISSDYRLKENVVPLTGALDKITQLKPSLYKYKADPSTSIEGFIAHELQEVVPHAVVGEKDAVDADGNPVYQGVDASFLIPHLTAAVQELKAIVDAQATKIAALEAKA